MAENDDEQSLQEKLEDYEAWLRIERKRVAELTDQLVYANKRVDRFLEVLTLVAKR